MCAPTEKGVNVIAIVHVPLDGIARLHPGSEKLNSLPFAPPSMTLVRCSAAVPALVTVTFIGVLDPTAVVPKSRLPGISVSAGAGVRPAPFNCADSVEGEALLVIVTAAVRLPAAEGVKETRT